MSEITDKWKNFRRDMGNLISQLDGSFAKLEVEEKRMEQKRDESYKKGAEDLKQTMLTIMSGVKDGGMSLEDIDEFFNAPNLRRILEAYSADDVIEKVKQWKEKEKEKTEELKPGDEVEVIKKYNFPSSDLSLGGKYVILPYDNPKIIKPILYRMIDLTNFNQTWAYADQLKKTGVVHRSLTIYFRGEENNEPSI